LPVAFTAAGVCAVTDATVHLTGAGQCAITARRLAVLHRRDPGAGQLQPARRHGRDELDR
jgi:hypothetical protein